ncbi:MAG: hypothetical protein JXR96_08090 [Deltaproteobacteria bacterium]|nr:hypothetical protein [Deltaproteobacteria bacterium]
MAAAVAHSLDDPGFSSRHEHMPRDVKTMTHKQLLRHAWGFLIAAAVSFVVLFAVFEFIPGGEMVKGVISFFGGFFILGGVGGGLYFLVRGLLRSRDWRPSESDWAMKGFDPERDGRKLAGWVRKELGGDLAGELRISHQPSGSSPPHDRRSYLRQFLESDSLIHVQEVLSCEIPLAVRPVTVLVEIGRSVHDASAHWVGIQISAPCRIRLSEPLFWTKKDKKFSGDARTAAALDGDPRISEILDRLVQHAYHGTAAIRRADSAFVLLPGEGEATAIAQTLPQDYRGGFALRLGLTDFLEVTRRIEDHDPRPDFAASKP